MPITFKHSPLVEIIAEVRWRPTFINMQLQPGSGLFGLGQSLIDVADQNALFNNLQAKLYDCGFPISERLIPLGVPAMPYQVFQRFRHPSAATLMQIGPGVFTVNAVPPYRSWHEFEPTLRQGIEALCSVRRGAEAGAPFSSVSLRYINSFKSLHLAGRTSAAFMQDVLGLYVQVPSSVLAHTTTSLPEGETLNVSFQIKDGLILALHVADGIVNAEPGLILDISVAAVLSETNQADTLAVLSRAHDVIHDIFIGMVEPIRSNMQPEDLPQCA